MFIVRTPMHRPGALRTSGLSSSRFEHLNLPRCPNPNMIMPFTTVSPSRPMSRSGILSSNAGLSLTYPNLHTSARLSISKVHQGSRLSYPRSHFDATSNSLCSLSKQINLPSTQQFNLSFCLPSRKVIYNVFKIATWTPEPPRG